MVTMKLASSLAGLGAASAINIRGFELSFDSSLFLDYKLGSTEPVDINNQTLKIEGNIEAMFGSVTMKDIFRNGTLDALRLNVLSPVVLGSAAAPEITIDLAKVAFEEFEKSDSLAEMAMQTIKFSGLYSVADSSLGTITLTNTKANYTA
jgi:hypothetical protein